VPAGSSYRVIGQVMTVKEIVTALTQGLGRDVAYRDIPDRAWADAAAGSLNPHALAHLSKLWANFRDRPQDNAEFAVTDTIEKLGGRRPKTFDEFVAEETHTFPGASPSPLLSTSSA
jgi:hypothetical protein